jgi:hypothetical protein
MNFAILQLINCEHSTIDASSYAYHSVSFKHIKNHLIIDLHVFSGEKDKYYTLDGFFGFIQA